MVKDQQEAEKKKVQSQEIQTEIEKQTIQIAQKQEHVKADLAQVEPAVIEAQQGNAVTCLWLEGVTTGNAANIEIGRFFFSSFFTAVKEIKKQQLVEVRSMANPPAVIKLALESICLLLGEAATDWKAIRAVVMRENFINSIVFFDTESIT